MNGGEFGDTRAERQKKRAPVRQRGKEVEREGWERLEISRDRERYG